VAVDDLVQDGKSYVGRAVKTHGRLELGFDSNQRSYFLRSLMYKIEIVPTSDVVAEWEREVMQMLGRDVQVTGVDVERDVYATTGQAAPYAIRFWSYTGPPEKEPKGEIKSRAVSLEALVTRPGANDGQMLRMVGMFRGRNLYGDLPVSTQRASADWVMKDDLYAVWITGREPSGPGWHLDGALKRDAGRWIEVIGKPETVGGVTYIEAIRVRLTSAPTASASPSAPTTASGAGAAAIPSPPLSEKPGKPPVVVFALPLDGDPEIPPDSRFVVQFSKDMDENTFAGHVVLRYAGPMQPGDRGFTLKLSYDRDRRALTIDPGGVLRPRRAIELILLPGISDMDGLALVPRATSTNDDTDVLRYRIGS
jgi:hypothetical protein